MATYLISIDANDTVPGTSAADTVAGVAGGADHIDLGSGNDLAQVDQLVRFTGIYDENPPWDLLDFEFLEMGPAFMGTIDGGIGTDTLDIGLRASPTAATYMLGAQIFSLRDTNVAGFEHLRVRSAVEISVAQLNAFQSVTHASNTQALDIHLFGPGGTMTLATKIAPSVPVVIIDGTSTTSGLDLIGTSKGDYVYDSAFADEILGGDGNDWVFHRGGNDVLVGGKGNDRIELDWNATSPLRLEDVASGIPLPDGTVITEFEIFAVNGGAADNIITGTGDTDYLQGGGGGDTINGGGARDSIYGEEGDDSLHGDEGNDFLTGDNGGDQLWGGAGNDTIRGGDGDDRLYGGDGNDDLVGDGGSDRLDGGRDVDTMRGRLGDDTYVVDNTEDTVVELAGQGTDSVEVRFGYILPEHVENLLLTGTADANGWGNAAANMLIGNASNNRLNGLAGNDRLDGRGGADTMIGGTGDDIFVVNNKGDVIVEGSGGGVDTVEIGFSHVLQQHLELATLTGAGTANVWGNVAGNVLRGNAGDNLITGLRGADDLTGGGGGDTFRYVSLVDSNASGGIDRILDFNFAEGDRVDVSAIDANALLAGNQTFDTLIVADAAFTEAGQFRFSKQGDSYLAEFNVNGNPAAELAIRFESVGSPEESWFML